MRSRSNSQAPRSEDPSVFARSVAFGDSGLRLPPAASLPPRARLLHRGRLWTHLLKVSLLDQHRCRCPHKHFHLLVRLCWFSDFVWGMGCTKRRWPDTLCVYGWIMFGSFWAGVLGRLDAWWAHYSRIAINEHSVAMRGIAMQYKLLPQQAQTFRSSLSPSKRR